MAVKDLIDKCKIIVFDCDSTLSNVEGIDVLARLKGIDTSDLTALAMEGKFDFFKTYKKRLDLIKPNQNNLEELGRIYIKNKIKDIDKVIKTLKNQEKEIHIVSGGLLPAVKILALNLGIENVHAVDIYFDKYGNYLDFEQHSPLTKNFGKKIILRNIRQNGSVCFIGDGMTDLEAQGEIDIFIGFGGVVIRKTVKEKSINYIEKILDLI